MLSSRYLFVFIFPCVWIEPIGRGDAVLMTIECVFGWVWKKPDVCKSHSIWLCIRSQQLFHSNLIPFHTYVLQTYISKIHVLNVRFCIALIDTLSTRNEAIEMIAIRIENSMQWVAHDSLTFTRIPLKRIAANADRVALCT